MAIVAQPIRETATEVCDIAVEEQARADLYNLLASLLSASPSPSALEKLAALPSGTGSLGVALGELARVARRVRPSDIKIEYHDLFIGLGRGELVPYASYYLTGFLQEKPLAQLRRDMAALGVGRSGETADPEDHVASILEMMAGLVAGRFGSPASLATQKEFFDRHIASWMPVFFRDLEQAKASIFYTSVGSLGRSFIEIESEAFEMA